jgi:membrane protein
MHDRSTAHHPMNRPPSSPRELSIRRRLRIVLVRSVTEWFALRCSSKGAAVAFYTLFSMAPILILALAVAGALFGQQAARGEIFEQLHGLLGPVGAQAIEALLVNAHNPDITHIATAIASVVLLIGTTTIFAELKESLDEIWHVPSVRQASLWHLLRIRLLSFGLVIVLVFLLLVSLIVSAALAVLEHYWTGLWHDAASILAPISSGFSYVVIAVLFGVIYKTLPQVRLSWHDVSIGAMGTAGLFILGKHLIGIYLGNSNLAGSYGAAGSLVALLLWIYYSAQIFFLGAGFTRQYALWFGTMQDHADMQDASR